MKIKNDAAPAPSLPRLWPQLQTRSFLDGTRSRGEALEVGLVRVEDELAEEADLVDERGGFLLSSEAMTEGGGGEKRQSAPQSGRTSGKGVEGRRGLTIASLTEWIPLATKKSLAARWPYR